MGIIGGIQATSSLWRTQVQVPVELGIYNHPRRPSAIVTSNSTTNCSLVCDTHENDAETLEPTTYAGIDQISNEGCVSSSYKDLELDIGGETVIIQRTRRTDMITSHLLKLSNGRFACLYCNMESHDKTNVATHIG